MQSGQLVSTLSVDDFPPGGTPVLLAGSWASLPACPHLQDRPASYPRQHLPLKTLKGLFQQQLSVEMATTITVDSVEKAPSLTTEVVQAVGAWPRWRLSVAELASPGLAVQRAGRQLSPEPPPGQGRLRQSAPRPVVLEPPQHRFRVDPSCALPLGPVSRRPKGLGSDPVSFPRSGRPCRGCVPSGRRTCAGHCGRPRPARPTPPARAARLSFPTCACSVRGSSQGCCCRWAVGVWGRGLGRGGARAHAAPPSDPAGAAPAGRVAPLPGAAARPAHLQPARGAEEAADRGGAGAGAALLQVPAAAGL